MSTRIHTGKGSFLLAIVLAAPATVIRADSPAAATALGDLPPVPRSALERFAQTDLEDWEYLRTRVDRDGVRVDRHDPTRPGAEHWQLVSIDGRTPTAAERKAYDAERADHSQQDERAHPDQVVAMLDAGSLRFLGTEAGLKRYRYRLQSPDGKREKVYRALEGEFLVEPDGDTPWVREARVWNSATLRPYLGLRIDDATLRFDFTVQDGWVLPAAVQARWSGAILAFKDFDRQVTVSLTGYRRVGDSSREALADRAAGQIAARMSLKRTQGRMAAPARSGSGR